MIMATAATHESGHRKCRNQSGAIQPNDRSAFGKLVGPSLAVAETELIPVPNSQAQALGGDMRLQSAA